MPINKSTAAHIGSTFLADEARVIGAGQSRSTRA
jgi:hypothetical protein